jgi:hypothetical protein
MASTQKDDSVGKRIRKEMREMRKKYKEQGYDDMEIESLMRDFFVQKAPAKKASTMTAAKGGVAKKRMARGGAVKKAAPKKMMRGGAATKKKMARGGYSKKK